MSGLLVGDRLGPDRLILMLSMSTSLPSCARD